MDVGRIWEMFLTLLFESCEMILKWMVFTFKTAFLNIDKIIIIYFNDQVVRKVSLRAGVSNS